MSRAARYNEIPYSTSPAIQMVYQATAQVNLAGFYEFVPALAAPVNGVTLRPQALYMVSEATFASDVPEKDYVNAITNLPSFQTYLRSEGQSPQFRYAMPLPMHLAKMEYRKSILLSGGQKAAGAGTSANVLLGGFAGKLTATASLIALGQQAITLTLVLFTYEITDAEFIRYWKLQYGQHC
jgi:hypothetical protein